LPGPVDVAESFLKTSTTIGFYQDIAITTGRSIGGMILSILVGVGFGALLGFSQNSYKIFLPFVTALQATPAISWLLIALVWFDPEIIPVLLVILSTFPIITLNTAEGIRTTDYKLVEMAKVFNVDSGKIVRKIYIPEIAGYIRSSFKISLGFAIKVALMAEVLAHPGSGIGERLSWARINVEMPDLVMYSAVGVIITLVLSRAFTMVDRND
jgi:NitT/TauT family transport system permease protein